MKTATTKIVLASVATLLLCEPAAAAPLPTVTGGFGIAPSRRYVVGNPGTALTPTTVSNTTGSGYQVSVFPVLLTQNLTGAFQFSSAPQDLSAAKLVLGASPSSFVMSTGQEQQVALSWNLLPVGKRWVAAGVVFQGVPQGQKAAVHVITRLLSVNFLRLPGPVTAAGVFAGLFPEQFAPRVLRFLARVKNTGNDFTAPSDGQLEIRDALGNKVLSEPWSGIQILPGATVDIPINVRKLLPAGRYTATVTMRFGGRHSETVPFTLVAPNEVPAPAIAIEDFNGTASVGSPARMTAKIRSTGTAPANVTLHLYLGAQTASPGQNALASTTVVYRNLAPGSVTWLSRPLGHGLRQRAYRAIVTWNDPTGAPHSLEAEFTATPTKSWLQSLSDSLKHHLVVLVGLLIIAAFLVLAYLYNKQRQRQVRLEAELAAACARASGGGSLVGTAPAAPPPNGAGDLPVRGQTPNEQNGAHRQYRVLEVLDGEIVKAHDPADAWDALLAQIKELSRLRGEGHIDDGVVLHVQTRAHEAAAWEDASGSAMTRST